LEFRSDMVAVTMDAAVTGKPVSRTGGTENCARMIAHHAGFCLLAPLPMRFSFDPPNDLGRCLLGLGSEHIMIRRPDNPVTGKPWTISTKRLQNRPDRHDRIDDTGEQVNWAVHHAGHFAWIIFSNEAHPMSHRGEILRRAAGNKLINSDLSLWRPAVPEFGVASVDRKDTLPDLRRQDVDCASRGGGQRRNRVTDKSTRQNDSLRREL